MKWEYFVMDWSTEMDAINLQEELDDMGTMGWELVSTQAIQEKIRYFMKRPLGLTPEQKDSQVPPRTP